MAMFAPPPWGMTSVFSGGKLSGVISTVIQKTPEHPSWDHQSRLRRHAFVPWFAKVRFLCLAGDSALGTKAARQQLGGFFQDVEQRLGAINAITLRRACLLHDS